MSTIPPLKLVGESDSRDVLPMERRGAPRYITGGRITALRTEHGPDGPRNRICSLQLVNMSDTGLGAIASEPVPTNTGISVFFPPHGPERGFDMVGRVVRCITRDDVHEIGIQFDRRAMAA